MVDGNTVSDADPDEQARQMSISTTLSSFEWGERKINLLDTPGEPSFVADAVGALRVCESAVFVVNAVMGVEVSTARLWARAAEQDAARMVFVNMLDRERADFFRTLEQLKGAFDRKRETRASGANPRFGQHVVATEIPWGAEHELSGVIDLVDMRAFRQDSAQRRGWTEVAIPEEYAPQAEEYREKLMDEVAEVSDTLMERYLEGEEISHEEIVGALKEGTNHGRIFPVVCGVATANLGTTRLLDAIVEDLPSPVKHGALRVGRWSSSRRRTASCTRSSSRPARTRSPGGSTCCASIRGRCATTPTCSTPAPTSRSGSASCSRSLARRWCTSRSSAPVTSAPWRSSRRPARGTGWRPATSRSSCPP